jgi:DNA-binding CsgD family transcriptional regulator
MLRVAVDSPADARTTATALVSVLAAIAEVAPVLIAIDDIQWLDDASARALEFAVRRMPNRAGVLATVRSGSTQHSALGMDRALPAERFSRIVVGPLSLAALRLVINAQLHTSLPRSVLARVAETSGGNPFFAVEMVRSRSITSGAVSTPRGVPKLALERIASLSANAREAVLVAALLSRPTVGVVTSALARSVEAERAVIEAEEAGVLITVRGRVRFSHPLLASAVAAAASDIRRRQLHRRLAEVVSDSEERARHWAEAATEPDEPTAAVVESGARQALLRGAYDAAIELFEASRRLTPAGRDEALTRRRLGQAHATLKTGDVTAARALAEGAATDGLPPALTVERLGLLAEVEWDEGRTTMSAEYLDRALHEAAADRALSAQILTRLVLVEVPADPARALEHADQAMRLVSEANEPHLLSSILVDRFTAGVLLGRGARVELLAQGLELEARAGPAAYPQPVPLIWFQSVDDVEATIARHDREDTWARERGDERMRAERAGYLALVHLQSGQWDQAEEIAERSCATLAEVDPTGRAAFTFAWRAEIDAYRGRLDRARSTLTPLVDEAARTEKAWWGAILLSRLGFVEYCAGSHEAVDAALSRMRRLLDSAGIREPFLARTEPFYIDSLLALGKLDQARLELDRLEERGRTIPRLWIDVTLPRARAQVRAAAGDPAGALRALDEVPADSASRLPFELASAWLVRGRVHRRLKQRRSAADAFREALTIFEQLGAPIWAERANGELAMVGPRRHTQVELTATELRVAELAASGLTNREVARATFMSAKTVETHLASIYRKLGIHSRAELGARVARQ